MKPALWLKPTDHDAVSAWRALHEKRRRAADTHDGDLGHKVRDIIDAIRTRGDQALFELTQKYDGIRLDTDNIRVSATEIAAAQAACDDDVLNALDLAAHRITDFHHRTLPQDLEYTDDIGVVLGMRWCPCDAAGLYVPGGTANYPTSVLMNAIPAKIAGVARLVMVTPVLNGAYNNDQSGLALNPLVLAAAARAGVDEIYRIGGAQAIAALAYGTATLAPVDVITGPGNAYVAEAKRQVFGQVGIDLIAGPSEVLVVASGDNEPSWVAADLLAQAEHDPQAQSILICDDSDFAEAVVAAIANALSTLTRVAVAQASWRDYGVIIEVNDLVAEAPVLINMIAPEHLHLACDTPESLLPSIRHAGAIFLGTMTPEALGDYIAGPNHILPTAGTARYASGLSVLNFMKRSTLINADANGFAHLADATEILARAEGLDAHARAIDIRRNRRQNKK